MAIESVSGAGTAYQGSTSQTAMRQSTEIRTDTSAAANTSAQLAQDTVMISSDAASGRGTQDGQRDEERQNEQIKNAVNKINKNNEHTEAVFGIHEGTNRVMIKIVDRDTKKIIKEFPPEKTLDMIEKVWEMAGLMVDERR